MWKIIDGFENYEVSDEGAIRSAKSHRVLKERPTNCGYARVILYKNNKPKDLLIHRLVAETFIARLNPEQTDVNHKDGDKRNNRVENLEWCTKSENIRHAQDIGIKTYDTISTKVIAMKKDEIINFKSMNDAGRFFNMHHESIKSAIMKNKPVCGYSLIFG